MKKIIFAIAMVILLVSLWGCAKTEEPKDPVTALKCGNKTVLCREGDSFAFFAGEYEGEISLCNIEDKELEVAVYTKDRTVTIKAAAGETAVGSAISGEICALRYIFDGRDESYAVNEAGIKLLLENNATEIILAKDVNIDGDLEVRRTATIKSENGTLTVSGKIKFVTDKNDILTLIGNITAAGIYADAPMGEMNVPENLVPEYPRYKLKLAKINGTTLEKDEHIVTSADELKAVSKNHIYQSVTLRDFKATEEITLSGFSLVTLENFDGAGLVTFKNSSDIKISGKFDADSIKVEAESLTVDNPIEITEAKKLYSVKKYCGADLSAYELGGDGAETIKSAILTAEGKMMTRDMEWTVDGFTLTCKYSGVCAPEALRDCGITFECDGTVTPDAVSTGKNGGVDLLSPLGCYVSVTDKNGKTVKYKIETEFAASLPVVVITTDGKEISREEYSNATVSVNCDFADEFESTPESEIQLKGRGNSTWKWSDKKPYKLRYENNVSLLGLCEGKDWVLLANYNDKTLIRNYIALEMAKFMDNMDCYATQIPVDVFMDGKYIGVYSLGEEIEAGDGRIEVKTDATSVDTGYIIEVGSDKENTFSTDLIISAEVLKPDNPTEEELEYIYDYFARADHAIKTEHGYEIYIDVDSLIDWLIITELSFNSDGAMRRSVFMKKDAGEKLEMAAMWDFDIAFGNSNTDFLNYREWATLATRYGYVRDNWICYLMKNEYFVSRLRDRWNEIKEPLYNFTCQRLDYAYSITKVSAEENFKVWDILWYPVGIEPYYIGWYHTYDEQVDFLRDFIDYRFSFLEKELNGGAE